MRRDSSETKRKILTVCVRLFLDQGYKNTSVSQIVDEAGVARGSYLNLFPTKDKILLDLTETMFGGQFGMARSIADIKLPPVYAYAVETAIQLTLTELNVTSTGASKDNVEGITDDEYGLAILQSDVLTYAHEGTNVFSTPETDALWVAGLYNETVQITAKGGITSVDQLKGKAVCVGDQGSGTEFNAYQVLEAYGMTADDIKVVHANFGEASEMLKNGQIDAAFTVAGAPTTAITELATSGMDFSLVSLDQEHVDALHEKYPFLVQENLPAGTYEGVDTETICVAVEAALVASTDMSEDAVYELTKTMFENLEELGTSHAKFQLVSAEKAAENGSVPMHPGAEKYYKEIGLL